MVAFPLEEPAPSRLHLAYLGLTLGPVLFDTIINRLTDGMAYTFTAQL